MSFLRARGPGPAANRGGVGAVDERVSAGSAARLSPDGQGPDLLFLDLNMPRKNGAECLKEIKADPRLRALPVIIYTTSLHEDVADLLYQKGAHFYMRKTDFPELKVMLSDVLKKFASGKFSRPIREHFVLNGAHLKYH